jgi:hypothetical protein
VLGSKADDGTGLGRPIAASDRLVQRNQVKMPTPDQIGAAHATKRRAQQRPVRRIVIAQEGFVQSSYLETARYMNLLAACAPQRP